jgi:paraquat-inducible protein A
MSSSPALLICRHCGHQHQAVPLEPGEQALCVRCDTVLAKQPRLGPDAALAFTLAGFVLAFPATLLPFVTAGKLGQAHTGLLLTSVRGLWDHDMHLLAVWVCLCGALVPLALLVTLTGLLLPPRLGRVPLHSKGLSQTAHALGHWAMPEVQVLAVLVALIKLGSLVDVTIGAGFWCYCALSVALLFAWRSFDVESAGSEAELESTASVFSP